jgi:hypothetical protein
MKRRYRRAWHVLGVLVMVVACGETREQILSEFPAPDGDYQLRLTLVTAGSASAPHHIKLYLLPRGAVAEGPVVNMELANDGAPFSGDQIGLTWIAKRTVLVCLKPRGEAHHSVRVELSDPPRVEKLARC